MAYYTTFSLAPLLVLVLAVTGLFGGRDAAQGLVMAQVEDLVGTEGRQFVSSMIENAPATGSGVIASILGAITLLIAALGAFNPLQYALNRIWDVKAKPVKGWGKRIANFIVKRLLSFSMLLGIGFLLLVSLVISAGLSALGDYLGRSDIGNTFGAAGSLALIMIWVYYSAQILFLGAV